MKKRIVIAVCILAFGAFFILSLTTIAYREWAFVNEATGSRKGFTEWALGFVTSEWYEPTELEAFAKEKEIAFEENWVSYRGDGKNIFGMTVLRGHGRPSRILNIEPEHLDRYTKDVNEQDKKKLIAIFKEGDATDIDSEVMKIHGFPK
jgi:hypothetical protein